MRMKRLLAAFLVFSTSLTFAAEKGSFDITKRALAPTSEENIRFQPVYTNEDWKASETAVIVCDMWDLHHCLNATRRGAELAPRMNQFLKNARKSSHYPCASSCMKPMRIIRDRKRLEYQRRNLRALPNGAT